MKHSNEIAPFEPSSWLLGRMIERAEAACDADVDQARRAAEERANTRYARAVANETEARRQRALYGED